MESPPPSGPDVAELLLAVEHRLRERTERQQLHVGLASPGDGGFHQLAYDSLTAQRFRDFGVIEDHQLPVRTRRERQLRLAPSLQLDEEGAPMAIPLDLDGNLWLHDGPS